MASIHPQPNYKLKKKNQEIKQFEQIMKDCQSIMEMPVKPPAKIRFQGVSECMRPSDTPSVTSSDACMQTEETCLVVET